MKTVLLAITVLLPASVFAQEEQWDKDAAIAELRELVLAKTPMGGWSKRKALVSAWLGKVRERNIDLGIQSYLLPIASYFGGDYAGAGQGMAEYLDQHKKLPSKEFEMIAGRILLEHAMTSLLPGGDIKAVQKAIPLALSLYTDTLMIYRSLGRRLAASDLKGSKKVLNELLVRALTDTKLSDTDKQALLKGIYAPKRGGGNTAGRGRSNGPKTLEAFTAKDLDGNTVSLEKYKGKVLLVDFWATWCGPCMREMPNVVAAYEKFQAKGFEVIGISLDKEPSQKRGGSIVAPASGSPTVKKIRETMKKAAMTWPVVYEGGWWNTRLAKANKIRSIPATFLIDRKGKVRYTNLRGARLAAKIQELLEEKR